MSKRPAWFDACILGGVFALILLPAGASLGFMFFVLNLLAIAAFVVPIVAAVKDGDLD